MEAYKFETTVLKNGIIIVPQLDKYINQQVEVSIVFKEGKRKKKQKVSTDEFLKKWTGFIPETNTEVDKYNYLMEKYA